MLNWLSSCREGKMGRWFCAGMMMCWGLVLANTAGAQYNIPPVACMSFTPPQPRLNSPMTVSASCSYDADGVIFRYRWWLDGTQQSGNVMSHTWTFTDPGSHTVHLQVQDDYGAWSTKIQRTFTPITYEYTITVVPADGGRVVGSAGKDDGIDCAIGGTESQCQERYAQNQGNYQDQGSMLVAIPDEGWFFVGWEKDGALMSQKQLLERALNNAGDVEVTPIFSAVTAITFCQPDDQTWTTELTWDDLISREKVQTNPLRIKVMLAHAVSLEGVQDKIELGVFSDATNITWTTIPLNAGNTEVLAQELRISLSWDELLALGVFLLEAADSVENEFISVDYIRNAESNDHDSEAFHDGMTNAGFPFRGKGRRYDETGQNGDESALVLSLNDAVLQAGGVQFLQVRAPGSGGSVVSPVRQVEDQADVLYYSGHGSHDGKYITYGPTEKFFAADAESAWKGGDIDTVIIAGCSILDIKDYNDNAGFAPVFGWPQINHTASPGEVWMGTGPKVFLGYNYVAPLDTQGGEVNATKQIVDSWFVKGGTSDPVNAWIEANEEATVNNSQIATNVCAIVQTATSWEYHYLRRKIDFTTFPPSFSYELSIVPYDEVNNKWPDTDPNP